MSTQSILPATPRVLVISRLAVLVACLLVATACVSLPEDGPVVSVEPADPGRTEETLVDFEPPPPKEGAEPEEIIELFLQSMLAAPLIRTSSVASEYLTQDAARAWQPTGTVVYADSTVSASPRGVQAELSEAFRIDGRGTWRGPLSAENSTIRFTVVLEDGEWRIDNPPQSLIVTRRFFDTRFDRATVHWFDPSGQVMVPEPVYVPAGESMPASLVERLLLGPPEELQGVVRSFLPSGLETPGVPITSDGEADVRLSAEFPEMGEDDLDRAFAQLAWTLRSVSSIEAVRITDPRGAVSLPGGRASAWVGEGAEFDASGSATARGLYALVDGYLASDTEGGFEPVAADVGQGDNRWRSFAIEPGGRRVVGVARSGRAAVLAPVESTDGSPVQIVSEATNLLKPAWDGISVPWLVDVPDGDGATVLLVGAGGVREIEVPGISGTSVRAFQVSGDGSRFVAIVHGVRADRLMAARVVRDGRGRVVRVRRAREVPTGADVPARMHDVAWRSPTWVRVLFSTSGDVSQVREVSLDGATQAVGAPVATVPGQMRGLVGSPWPTTPAYAWAQDEVVGLGGAQVPPLPESINRSTLTYSG